MARIWLVRHAEAIAGWGDERDPALSLAGCEQAEAMARRLAPLGPLTIHTSPLRRCRETAAPLAARWDRSPVIDDVVGEIAAPVEDLEQRTLWLRDVMQRRWDELTDRDRQWRDGVVDHICGLDQDTVIITHFVLTNAVVGAATGDDRVVCFRPANCSATVVEVDGTAVHLLSRGQEMDSRVL